MSKLHPAVQFLIALLITALGIAVCVIWGFEKGGYILAGAVAGAILGVFLFGIVIWRISHTTLNKVVYMALISLAGAAAIPLMLPSLATFGLQALWPTLRGWWPSLAEQAPAYTIQEAWPALLFLLLFAWLAFHSLRPRDVTSIRHRPLTDDFPGEPNFVQRLEMFAGLLTDDLAARDRETNWSHAYFTPLEAEVEAQGSGRRRLTDLLSALRGFRKSRAFLVLGDPGSGKSVALRQLTRELLKEVPRTAHIPLYVNLREWKADPAWTNLNLPPVSDIIASLHHFVKSNVSERLDIAGQIFIRDHFDRLLETGRLFLILDSFDEIGVLLDAGERTPIVHRFSDAIGRFIRGNYQGRGILASRIFHRPTDEFPADSRLEIRPLSDSRVQIFIRRRFDRRGDSLLRTLLTTRHDLLAAARNPFTAALLMDYVEHHPGSDPFPPHRAQLYEDYTRQRICDATQLYKREHHAASLWDLCCHLGHKMLQRATLEIPAAEIEAEFSTSTPEDSLQLLTKCRLLRTGSGTDRNISFSHRRFAEFFAATEILASQTELPLDAIPSDSNWRDTLVIFSEICPDYVAHFIAGKCIVEIGTFVTKPHADDHDQRIRSIHTLRFMVEAFSGRSSAYEEYIETFANVLEFQLKKKLSDILQAKHLVEAACLLPAKRLPPLLSLALNGSDNWVQETAFSACRRIENANKDLESSIAQYLKSVSPLRLFRSGGQMNFSLSVCPYLSRVQGFLMTLRFQAFIFLAMTLLLSLVGFIWLITSSNAYLSELTLSAISIVGIIGMISTSLSTNSVWLDRTRHLKLAGLSSPFLFLTLQPLPQPLRVPSGLVCLVLLCATFVPGWIHGRLFPVAKKQDKMKIAPIVIPFILIGILVALFIIVGMEVIKIIISWLLFVAGLFALIIACRTIGGDWRLSSKTTISQVMNREEVHEIFCRFRTQRGRFKFVQKLSTKHVRATGVWPEGHAPNKGDPASTLLAQLDEKWLGLDQ